MSDRADRRKLTASLAVIVLLAVGVVPVLSESSPASAATAVDWPALQTLLSRSTSTTTAPPTQTPSDNIPDGSLLGNGHMTAAVGGPSTAQTFYVGASDFWADGGEVASQPRTIGGVTVSIPSLAGSSYQQQQDISAAEVRSTFATSSATVTQRSWISANEDLMVTTLTNASTSTASPAVSISTFAGTFDSMPTTSGLTSANTLWATRTSNSTVWLANAALASRVLGGSSVTYTTNNSTSAGASFTLAPGQTVQIATVLKVNAGNVSGYQYPAPASMSSTLSSAQTRVGQVNTTSGNANSVLDADALRTAHNNWWKTFWTSGANIDLGGSSMERYWYTALYAIAISNRAGKQASGMSNVVTTDTPQWGGNWSSNYNFAMTYQGLYAANHIETTLPFEQSIMDCLAKAKAYATSQGYQGALYPSGTSIGGEVCNGTTWGMQNDAAWLATNFILHWKYTRDTTWATNTGYPYLIEVANFADKFLTKTDGVYHVIGSAQNERSSYKQDPIGDLAWLRGLYPAILDMSQTLNVDSSRRALWQDISNNLAPYPTWTNNGRTEFKATADTPGFYYGDANPINPVFPGNQIDLGSPVSAIVTAQNTIDDLNVWCQGNSFAWIFPAAARVGYPGTYTLLNNYLNNSCGNRGLRGNSTIVQDGGGGETFGGIETISSMLMTSATGSIRLFQAWPRSQNASFTNMLANGAFTVTSSLASGVVGTTTITSNAGQTASVASPWAPGTIAVTDLTTNSAVTLTAGTRNVVTFPTTAGHDYRLTGTGSFDYTRLNLAELGTASTSTSRTEGAWSPAKLNDGVQGSTAASLGWTSSDAGTGSNHTEWAQIDLGSSRPVGQLDLYPRSDSGQVGAGFPVDFTIAVSNDGTNWTTVLARSGVPKPSGVQSYTFAPQSARYVRVTGTSLRANPNDGGRYRMQLAEIAIYAPVNLARTAPTSASSTLEQGAWSVNYLVDSAYATGWTSTSSLGSNHTEWAQVDLGTSQAVGQVDLYPRSDSGNVGQGFPVDFTIAVSNDTATWTTVVTKTGYALPAAVKQSFTFGAQNARYVRVTGTSLRANTSDSSNYRMQLAELEVYAPVNSALTASAVASSSFEGFQWGVGKVNDNNAATGWSSGGTLGSNHTEWVQLDQGAPVSISQVDLTPRTDSGNVGQGFPADFTIAVSNDGTNWTTVVTKTGYAVPTGTQSFPFTATSARYVRVTGTTLRANPNDSGSYRMQLAEFSLR